MKIGYARVSTQDQCLDTQINDLKKDGCEKIFSEKVSAAKKRPQLDALLSHVRAGDTVVIWKLDRLGRSVKHLIELSEHFSANDIQLVSIKDSIDTTTPAGRMVFNMMASLAEFERELIRERTRAAMQTARDNGRLIGRPKVDSGKIRQARNLWQTGAMSISEICSTVGISRPTFYAKIKNAPELKAVS